MAHKISIILATYNRVRFIAETLESLQAQTYEDFECLIIDDGSTDGTSQILEPILVDKRFKHHKRPDEYQKGLPGCRNFGLDMAKGDYVLFCDDDDIVHPDNLNLCVDYLVDGKYDFCRYERVVFIGDFDYKFDDVQDIGTFHINGRKDLKRMLTNELPFNSCAVMWRRTCFENLRFEESLMYAEEWECYQRILSNDAQGISISPTLYHGRKHVASNTGEFFQGMGIRIESKVKASKLVISNLDALGLLDDPLIHFFTWESVLLKSRSLFEHLMARSSIKVGSRLKYSALYYGSPFVKWFMKSKKRLRAKRS